MKRVILIVMLAVVAFALPAAAQTFKSSDKQATAPSAAFQSTSSAMMSSGSQYAPTPTLNADGSATYKAPSIGRDGKVIRGVADPINTDDDIPEGGGLDTPLGDALWPLMFLALAFAGYTALRRRRALSKK